MDYEYEHGLCSNWRCTIDLRRSYDVEILLIQLQVLNMSKPFNIFTIINERRRAGGKRYQMMKQDEFCDLVLKSVSTEGTVTSTRKTHQAMLATIPHFDMMFSYNSLETQTKEA